MRWSLSEFLNMVELRSQTWCFVDLASAGGFSIPHNEEIYFYALLEGSANIAGIAGDAREMRTGDIVMILSGEAHALRNRKKCPAPTLEFLSSGTYADAPPTLTVGEGGLATRLLAGRLKVRWPGGQHPRSIPSVLSMHMNDDIVNYARLLDKVTGSGAMAVLTRAASLLFVTLFREHPQCRAAFQQFDLHDPISRAQQYIETHPFNRWTVETLAHKVGMGRSNFATRFAKEVARTPMEFMSDERMKHAALFLEKTDMKIVEIGTRVGYRSEAAFIRRFTSRFGITPGEMRKRSREADHKPQDQRASALAGSSIAI
jgi:AraC family transcriptional activator of mtrCDE